MAQFLSHAHVNARLNGHELTGWADEDRPVEFNDGSGRIDFTRGADGGLYGVASAMFGGEVTFKVQPTSPTAQWAMQRNQELKESQKNGRAIEIFSGTYSDSVQGRSARFEGGAIQDCPDMAEPGQTFEFTMHFEQIDVNVDGAVFRRPLASA